MWASRASARDVRYLIARSCLVAHDSPAGSVVVKRPALRAGWMAQEPVDMGGATDGRAQTQADRSGVDAERASRQQAHPTKARAIVRTCAGRQRRLRG